MRQYIGARYVPKFMGTYDPTQSYEALCVVDNGQGTSYIAKVPTPANTPLTDTTYWTIYGAASGAIINLQNQIDTINNVDLPAIEAEIASLDNKHFLIVGDSYDVVNTGYKWSDTAMNKLGISDYETRAAGGYGFAPVSNLTWLSLIQTNPVDDNDAITDIIIGGGANDAAVAQATVVSGMSAFDTYIRATYPNLKNIYVAYMGWNHSSSADAKNDQNNAMVAYLTGAKSLGWHFLNGVQNVLKNPGYILTGVQDKLHPNPSGVIALGECVALAIHSGMAANRANFNASFAINDTLFSAGSFTVRQTLLNDILEVKIPDISLTTVDNVRGFFTLGTCSDLLTAFSQNKYWMANVEYNNELLPAIIYSSTPNELNIWLRTSATIPSGATIRVIAMTITDIL